MNLNNFTIKAQEAVQQAVQLATQNGQQAIEAVHLLKGVIMTGESVTNFIFQKLGVNIQNLNRVLDAQISSLPKVSGGEPYLSSEANAVLQKAIGYSSKMGDQYVSLEPIILALFTEKSTASQILKDTGSDSRTPWLSPRGSCRRRRLRGCIYPQSGGIHIFKSIIYGSKVPMATLIRALPVP